ncbi:MAG: aminopeptidase [Solirubrobacteraceae bacterium]|nr:aminopeptidase [Solirubrobacteraceae bacterium]
MALDPARFAELLCGYCLEVQRGQQVLVRSSTAATELLLALQRAILEREAWPLIRVELPGETAAFYEHARDIHLDDIPRTAFDEAKRIDASLAIQAPTDAYELQGVDPERVARFARARRDVREQIMKKRWCTTLWPTAAAAERAGMSFDAFSAFVERALFLDQPDAVASWGGLSRFQSELIDRLRAAHEIRIEAEGTDLVLAVKGRTWVNSDGRRNMPSGEVFTGPVETSAEGHIRFDIPSGPPGRAVSGVAMELRAGEVVSARADEGDEHLQAALATDAGARRLGELGIGTNFGIDRPVGAILFDEKIGGTVHLAIGRSYPETGGKNTSAVHWDLICDLRRGGQITADGAVIQQDGKFVV